VNIYKSSNNMIFGVFFLE